MLFDFSRNINRRNWFSFLRRIRRNLFYCHSSRIISQVFDNSAVLALKYLLDKYYKTLISGNVWLSEIGRYYFRADVIRFYYRFITLKTLQICYNPLIMKRIYFDLDNTAFIAWLKTHPTGAYKVLLGSDTPDDSLDALFAKVTTEGVDLAKWLTEKLQRGEMVIHVNTKIELPQGIVLE
jgi:hypothetical protein